MSKRNWNILSAVVLVLIAIIVFNRNNIASFFSATNKSEISIKKINSYKLAALKSPDSVYSDGDRYYIFYNNRLTCYGMNGNAKWYKDFSHDASIMGSKSNLLVVDKKNGNIYLFDKEGRLQKSILGLGEVNTVDFGDDGRCVVRLNDNKNILIYDKHMKLVSNTTIENGTIIEQNVNFKTNRIAVLVLEDLRGEVASSVIIFDMNGDVVFKKEYNEELLSVLSNDKGYLFLYKNRIVQYGQDFRQLDDTVGISDIRYFNFAPNQVILINNESKNSVDSDYYLKTYDINKNKIGINAKIDVKYSKIIFKDGIFVAIVDNRIDIYNQSGTLLHTKEQKNQVENLFILDQNRLLVLEENILTLYEIIK